MNVNNNYSSLINSDGVKTYNNNVSSSSRSKIEEAIKTCLAAQRLVQISQQRSFRLPVVTGFDDSTNKKLIFCLFVHFLSLKHHFYRFIEKRQTNTCCSATV